MEQHLISCPGCRGCGEALDFTRDREPVVSNYLCESPEAAAASAVGRISLAHCLECGLIFNSGFDPGLVPYDERYDNSQNHSPIFRAHLAELCGRLVSDHQLGPESLVLEIGCGKGAFLGMLVEACGGRGIGFDTTYAGPLQTADGRVSYVKGYVTSDLDLPAADLLVCRHVVEHVPHIGEFFRDLAAISSRCGGAPIAIETPDFEWIACHGAFWDICYEHCNYFTKQCLANLARRGGLEVLEHRNVFGGQYQLLVVRPGKAAEPIAAGDGSLICEAFLDKTKERIKTLEERIPPGSSKQWLIWGAGAKGVGLANRLAHRATAIVDINAAKQGLFAPGSGIPIVAPDSESVRTAELVILPNPQYREEIIAQMKTMRQGLPEILEL